MTCYSCQKMPLPALNQPGSCSKCHTKTSSKAITLCGNCAKTNGLCNRCQRPVSGTPGSQKTAAK